MPSRAPRVRRGLPAVGLGLACLWLYFGTLARVPFHPDESDWIFMSRDLDVLRHEGIRGLVWKPGEPMTDEVRARLLNLPLTKYVIGAGRWVSGQDGERVVQWDWSATWDDNARAGSLPSPAVLIAARGSVALAAVLSLVCVFGLGTRLHSTVTGLVGALTLATQPLIMLHTRRAMASGVQQLCSTVAVLGLFRFTTVADRSPGSRQALGAAAIAGAGVGLAASASQSAAALMALGIVASGLVAGSANLSWPARVRVAGVLSSAMIISALAMFVLLNPVTYAQPVRALRLMTSMPLTLVARQAERTLRIVPSSVMPTIDSRISALPRELFQRRPTLSELPDYDHRLVSDYSAYEDGWLLRVWHTIPARLLFLLLAGVGWTAAVVAVARDRASRRSRAYQIVLAWIGAEAVLILLAIPLDWQRFFVPLFPPVCLLSGVGFAELLRLGGALPLRNRVEGDRKRKVGGPLNQAEAGG